jgi:GH15 family glucan-1,4-alpha-glucosidase
MHQPSALPSFLEPIADPAIGDYGAIGDCRTLALVSRFGSIDWWCVPEFSSPSCFAALLDRERGGRFALTPRDIDSAQQRYLPESNVLCSRFRCRGGVLELIDFMTVPEASGAHGEAAVPQEIVRLAHCVAGSVELQALFQPRPGYAQQLPRLEPQGDGCWHCRAGDFSATLSTSMSLRPGPDATLTTVLRLDAGDCHVAMLRCGPGAADAPASIVAAAQQRLALTLRWWQDWCRLGHYEGDHADAVRRSALALKLLTHRPTGAVVAAGTTSVPEGAGGDRNWDYRYCWLRDTSLVLHAFTDLGHAAESDAFMRWLLHATRRTRPRLQVMYDVHGGTELDERVLPQLRGYHGIGPVRIGNAASRQRQNDVYGELLLTACDDVHLGADLDKHEQALLVDFAGVVCDIWREPDHGIWEVRLPPRHNTHSKVMCWTALDRALRLHRDYGLPIDAERITRERDAIRADIEANGFCEAVGSYVGYYGSQAADATVLLMPRLRYIDANAPRMRSTVDYVLRTLSVDGLLHRYPPGESYDGVDGPEQLFAICSFWCVDCLARQGRVDEAEAMYGRLLDLRNHVGLYAEEFRVDDKRPMGNFPQAFSHVGAITAALSLREARRNGCVPPGR